MAPGLLTDSVVAAGQSMNLGLIAEGSSTLFLNFLLSMSLSLLWGMINVAQLMVHLPIFSLTFPGLASLLFSHVF